MNNEERELINNLFERISGKGSSQAGSVPAVHPLPPIDPEANQLILQNFQNNPEAAYRLTQMTVVQEAALIEAQNRIRQLEWQLQQMNQQLQQSQQNQQRTGGGFFSGLFGGANRQQSGPTSNAQMPPGWGGNVHNAAPRGTYSYNASGNNPSFGGPAPTYPPGYQQGMFNRGGTGFLGGALSTAAGVAGGMFAYNALSSLFGGHSGSTVGTVGDPTASDPFVNTDPFAGEGTAVDPNFDASANGDGDSGFDSGWDGTGSDADTDTGWGDNDSFNSDDNWGGGDDGGWGDDSF